MRFGVGGANVHENAEPSTALRLARVAERCGADSLWVAEHVVVPVVVASSYPYSKDGKPPRARAAIADPLVWLAWVASQTNDLLLATGVVVLPQRNPLILAKEVATLDRLSGGRVILGVGAGWMREEYEALGVPFNDRGKRLDEWIAVLRALWADEVASFAGDFAAFDSVAMEPKPLQRPVPIIVGGHSHRAARRAGRLGDGFFPGVSLAADLEPLLKDMRAAAREVGRDPARIEVTVASPADLEEAKKLRDMGVSRLTVAPFVPEGQSLEDHLCRYAEEFIAKL